MANNQNLKNHQFKKGQSGNPLGRKAGLPSLKNTIAEMLGEGNEEVLKLILEAQLKKAIKGDLRAAQFLIERAYGKPSAQIELTEQPKPIVVNILAPEDYQEKQIF
jgi:hypothetical protein